MAPSFAATPLNPPSVSPLMAPPMFDTPLPPPPPAPNFPDDGPDYDDVTDDMSVLQLDVKPPRTLLQHMFCLPLN